MKLWPVAHFFSLTFGIGEHTKYCSMSFLYSNTRNDMLQCFVCSPIPKVSEKKWATGQSFIRKEITSYRISTLAKKVKIRLIYAHCQYQFDLMQMAFKWEDKEQAIARSKFLQQLELGFLGWDDLWTKVS